MRNIDIKTRFVYVAPEVEPRLREIMKRIYLRMNGVTADEMKKSGIGYIKNYGVSYPEIKQLATKYLPDKQLARTLWQQKIRETMLLAILLHPVESFDEELAEAWVGDVNTLELAENLSRNILGKLAVIGTKLEKWVSSDNEWTRAVGYFAAAYGIDLLTEIQKERLMMQIKTTGGAQPVSVCQGMALFLRKFGCAEESVARRILQCLDDFSVSLNRSERYIFEEVRTDLVYRFEL